RIAASGLPASGLVRCASTTSPTTMWGSPSSTMEVTRHSTAPGASTRIGAPVAPLRNDCPLSLPPKRHDYLPGHQGNAPVHPCHDISPEHRLDILSGNAEHVL